jgi:hypothetical protein
MNKTVEYMLLIVQASTLSPSTGTHNPSRFDTTHSNAFLRLRNMDFRVVDLHLKTTARRGCR